MGQRIQHVAGAVSAVFDDVGVGEGEGDVVEAGFAGDLDFLGPALGVVGFEIDVEGVEGAQVDVGFEEAAGGAVEDPGVFVGVGLAAFDDHFFVAGGEAIEVAGELEGAGEIGDEGFDDVLIEVGHFAQDGDAGPVHADVEEDDAHFGGGGDAEVPGVVVFEDARGGDALAGGVDGGEEGALEARVGRGGFGPMGKGGLDAVGVEADEGDGAGVGDGAEPDTDIVATANVNHEDTKRHEGTRRARHCANARNGEMIGVEHVYFSVVVALLDESLKGLAVGEIRRIEGEGLLEGGFGGGAVAALEQGPAEEFMAEIEMGIVLNHLVGKREGLLSSVRRAGRPGIAERRRGCAGRGPSRRHRPGRVTSYCLRGAQGEWPGGESGVAGGVVEHRQGVDAEEGAFGIGPGGNPDWPVVASMMTAWQAMRASMALRLP